MRSDETSAQKQSVATLYDVCRLSGVSTATVSRVFTGTARVSDRVRKRVMAAADELAYEPSHAARSLAAKRTNTLGVILPEIAGGFYAEVLTGIDEVAAGAGYDVLAAFAGVRRSQPELIRRLGGRGRVDALLLVNLNNESDLPANRDMKVPLVLIDHQLDGAPYPSVGIDNDSGAAAMIQHLAEQGHRRIAIMTGPEGNFDSGQRLQACRREMARLGMTLHDELILPGEFTVDSGERAVRRLFAADQLLPDVLFCLNDAMAIGALRELTRVGIRVPGDLALAGFDNVEAADHIGLTSISCPMRLMGQIACRQALGRINGTEVTDNYIVQVRLMVRQSSGPKTAKK